MAQREYYNPITHRKEWSEDANQNGWADAVEDPDGDGLASFEEAYLGTNKNDADSDDDGINDALDDKDGDGLTNVAEIRQHHTDPSKADTDGDGLDDGQEVAWGTKAAEEYVDWDDHQDQVSRMDNWTGASAWNPVIASNKTVTDTDQDGIRDGDEILLGYNPTKADTDDDGLRDGSRREQIQTESDGTYDVEVSAAAGDLPVDVLTADVSKTAIPLDVMEDVREAAPPAARAQSIEADALDDDSSDGLRPVDPTVFEEPALEVTFIEGDAHVDDLAMGDLEIDADSLDLDG